MTMVTMITTMMITARKEIANGDRRCTNNTSDLGHDYNLQMNLKVDVASYIIDISARRLTGKRWLGNISPPILRN